MLNFFLRSGFVEAPLFISIMFVVLERAVGGDRDGAVGDACDRRGGRVGVGGGHPGRRPGAVRAGVLGVGPCLSRHGLPDAGQHGLVPRRQRWSVRQGRGHCRRCVDGSFGRSFSGSCSGRRSNFGGGSWIGHWDGDDGSSNNRLGGGWCSWARGCGCVGRCVLRRTFRSRSSAGVFLVLVRSSGVFRCRCKLLLLLQLLRCQIPAADDPRHDGARVEAQLVVDPREGAADEPEEHPVGGAGAGAEGKRHGDVLVEHDGELSQQLWPEMETHEREGRPEGPQRQRA